MLRPSRQLLRQAVGCGSVAALSCLSKAVVGLSKRTGRGFRYYYGCSMPNDAVIIAETLSRIEATL